MRDGGHTRVMRRPEIDELEGAAGAARAARPAEAERQLERYAADLRETFKQERERRRELEASYAATVRALSNAVEARDAYTRKHAERVTAYGLLLARTMELPLAESTEIEFGFLLHDIGKLGDPGRDPVQARTAHATRSAR